jgi:hypothetical protein
MLAPSLAVFLALPCYGPPRSPLPGPRARLRSKIYTYRHYLRIEAHSDKEGTKHQLFSKPALIRPRPHLENAMRPYRVAPVIVVSAVVALFSMPAVATKPASQVAVQSSWDPPLLRRLPKATQDNRPNPRTMTLAPGSAGPGAYWLTEMAVLALSATGKVTAAGRDTTADIGKPLPGIRTDQYQPAIRGAIK